MAKNNRSIMLMMLDWLGKINKAKFLSHNLIRYGQNRSKNRFIFLNIRIDCDNQFNYKFRRNYFESNNSVMFSLFLFFLFLFSSTSLLSCSCCCCCCYCFDSLSFVPKNSKSNFINDMNFDDFHPPSNNNSNRSFSLQFSHHNLQQEQKQRQQQSKRSESKQSVRLLRVVRDSIEAKNRTNLEEISKNKSPQTIIKRMSDNESDPKQSSKTLFEKNYDRKQRKQSTTGKKERKLLINEFNLSGSKLITGDAVGDGDDDHDDDDDDGDGGGGGGGDDGDEAFNVVNNRPRNNNNNNNLKTDYSELNRLESTSRSFHHKNEYNKNEINKNNNNNNNNNNNQNNNPNNKNNQKNNRFRKQSKQQQNHHENVDGVIERIDNENNENGSVNQQTANNEQPFATLVFTVSINDKIKLPCDIQPPSLDDQIVLVLWYKDDQLAPILTFDGRKNQLDPGAIQVSAPTLRGRAFFNIHGKPAHLSIDPVAASDEGDYRCRVDFRKARTINTVISLKVIIPPQKPKITDQDGNILNGLIGPYNEGDELIMTCSTKGGKPRSSLIWWRDYAIIDDSFEFDDRDVTTNELIITRLARHHLLTIFMCQAINSNITSPQSNSITLDLNLKPSEVRITQLTPILVAGQDALFECNTFGSRPMPIIYWLFDGNRYDTRIHGEQQTGSTLTLRLERKHRGATLVCVTENLRIPNSSIRDQLVLEIQYPPILEVKLGAPSLSLDSIQEGIDIYFDCLVDSNPFPTTPIQWLFNGRPLRLESGVIESNQSLVLQRVPRWRNGTYQCRCSNQQGTTISNELHLEIKFAPICQVPYTLIYGVQLEESIRIECDVDSRPQTDVTFQWFFEKQKILDNFLSFNTLKSILDYTPKNREQYGLIECVAKNSIGIQREPCRYLIVPVTSPHFPYNCLVSNQSDSTLSIRCDGLLFNSYKNNNNENNDDVFDDEIIDYNQQSNSLVRISLSSNNQTKTSFQSERNPNRDQNNYRKFDNRDDRKKNTFKGRESTTNGSVIVGVDDLINDNNDQTDSSNEHNQYEQQTYLDRMLTILSNMSTLDIYSMYFAPDDQETIGNREEIEVSDTDRSSSKSLPIDNELSRQQQQQIKMTYRNGIGPFQSFANSLQQPALKYRAQLSALFLSDLVPKLNSHSFQHQPPLLVYPPTYYVCEIFTSSSHPILIKNITIDAIEKRIMNPLNGSFLFRIDDLPPNTPLKVNIYARNNRKRSPFRIELDTKTLRAAERRIDYDGHHQNGEGNPRGRKSSSTFFDELYGGYGRFRNKHLVVGFMISTVAVTVIIAIILITIAILRSRRQQQQQQQQQQCHRSSLSLRMRKNPKKNSSNLTETIALNETSLNDLDQTKKFPNKSETTQMNGTKQSSNKKFRSAFGSARKSKSSIQTKKSASNQKSSRLASAIRSQRKSVQIVEESSFEKQNDNLSDENQSTRIDLDHQHLNDTNRLDSYGLCSQNENVLIDDQYQITDLYLNDDDCSMRSDNQLIQTTTGKLPIDFDRIDRCKSLPRSQREQHYFSQQQQPYLQQSLNDRITQPDIIQTVMFSTNQSTSMLNNDGYHRNPKQQHPQQNREEAMKFFDTISFETTEKQSSTIDPRYSILSEEFKAQQHHRLPSHYHHPHPPNDVQSRNSDTTLGLLSVEDGEERLIGTNATRQAKQIIHLSPIRKYNNEFGGLAIVADDDYDQQQQQQQHQQHHHLHHQSSRSIILSTGGVGGDGPCDDPTTPITRIFNETDLTASKSTIAPNYNLNTSFHHSFSNYHHHHHQQQQQQQQMNRSAMTLDNDNPLMLDTVVQPFLLFSSSSSSSTAAPSSSSTMPTSTLSTTTTIVSSTMITASILTTTSTSNFVSK